MAIESKTYYLSMHLSVMGRDVIECQLYYITICGKLFNLWFESLNKGQETGI